MKYLYSLIFLLAALYVNAQKTKTEYLVYDGEYLFKSKLEAKISNKVFHLLDQEDLCFEIEKIADFNNDGYEDVLIKIINGCGGNCCGNSYTIFTYNGKKFIQTEVVGYDWDDIEIIQNGTEYIFVIENTSEGFGNTDYCNNYIGKYQLTGSSLKLREHNEETEVKALKDIKASDFEDNDQDELHIYYDIDDDGKLDKITYTYWERWGRISEWNIYFGNGKVYKGTYSAKRIGILVTKTNGMHDLVFDCGEIVKWDGNNYE